MKIGLTKKKQIECTKRIITISVGSAQRQETSTTA